MDIRDLPRDINAQVGAIRAPLVRLVNSSRHSESKRKLLIETLKCALVYLEPVEEAPKKTSKKKATAKVKKAEVLDEAAKDSTA